MKETREVVIARILKPRKLPAVAWAAMVAKNWAFETRDGKYGIARFTLNMRPYSELTTILKHLRRVEALAKQELVA